MIGRWQGLSTTGHDDKIARQIESLNDCRAAYIRLTEEMDDIKKHRHEISDQIRKLVASLKHKGIATS